MKSKLIAPARKHLNPLWAKAALLGSTWGSIEIVVGSFLHNLRVPLTGTILSAIGVALLVAGYLVWRESGLIWRAGVVCALMKSISPSAVILGPMIGILTEAVVLELVVRASRGTTIGVVIGSGIAVCLPLVQTIVSLILTYGLNIAKLWVETFKFVIRNIGLQGLTAYQALGILLSLNFLLGFCAAFLGMAIGRRVAADELIPVPDTQQGAAFALPPANPLQRFSTIALVVNLGLIPFMMLAIGNLPLGWSAVFVGAYVGAVAVRYPGSRKRFSKPRIWIGLILVTSLAGLIFGEISTNQSGESGMLIGLQMSLRAVFMVAAFSAVSIELRNPAIVNWVLRRGFGQLASALEVAFDALPTFAAAIGEERRLLRHPVVSLSRLFLIAKHRVKELEQTVSGDGRVFIVTGDRGAGKTTALSGLAAELQQRNLCVAGILSPSVRQNSSRIGYDVVNIRTGKCAVLCRIQPEGAGVRIGDWGFLDDGIRFGVAALDPLSVEDCDAIIVDEVGPLELEGKVWGSSLDRLLAAPLCPILLVVREELIERVQERWSFVAGRVWKFPEDNSTVLLEEMLAVVRPFHKTS